MNYYGTVINDSPTVAGEAAAALTSAEYLAAKFDSDGKIVVCSTAGELPLGLLGAEEGTKAAGDTVSVQIKECGLWKVGAAVAAGAALATNAAGKAVTAASGQFILAIALKAATAADQVIPVQIVKAGYAS